MRALAAVPREQHLPVVRAGFFDLQSFEFMQRVAKGFAASTLVPAAYRAVTIKTDKFGNEKSRIENPNALANCVIALNMAQRMNADPLSLMQNLYIVEGRPSWSSQWIIAAINSCGRFSPLRFEIKSLGEKTVDYQTTYWENNERRSKIEKVKITDKLCIAWAKELATGERIESPPVTIEMAVREGWYSKNGSKWQTMDEVMLRYRTASFFGKLYAPELLMGLNTVEESQDIIEMEPMQTRPAMPLETLRETGAPTAKPTTASESAQANVVDPDSGEITLPASNAEATTEADAPKFDANAFAERLEKCTDLDTLDLMVDEIRRIPDEDLQLTLTDIYKRCRVRVQQLQAPAAPASRRTRGSSASME
jgi:hypothetical protein